MVPFDMPLDARLALAKMSVIYEREVGNKIRMSRDEDIVSLINFAVDSFNEEIIKYLDAFLKLLGPGEVKQLVAQGANIYRGAIVKDEEPFISGDSERSTGEGVRMYRGVPVAPDEATSKSSATDKAPGSGAPKKGKRVYRGRIIED